MQEKHSPTAYQPPRVVELGSLAGLTRAGDQPNSDVMPFADGTAIGPPDNPPSS